MNKKIESVPQEKWMGIEHVKEAVQRTRGGAEEAFNIHVLDVSNLYKELTGEDFILKGYMQYPDPESHCAFEGEVFMLCYLQKPSLFAIPGVARVPRPQARIVVPTISEYEYEGKTLKSTLGCRFNVLRHELTGTFATSPRINDGQRYIQEIAEAENEKALKNLVLKDQRGNRILRLDSFETRKALKEFYVKYVSYRGKSSIMQWDLVELTSTSRDLVSQVGEMFEGFTWKDKRGKEYPAVPISISASTEEAEEQAPENAFISEKDTKALAAANRDMEQVEISS